MSIVPPAFRSAKRVPRFSRETADVRRRQLIEAATRALAKGGIAAFTIDTICKEAKVSRGLINHHFGSLDDLLVEVYQSSLYESVRSQIEEARRLRQEQSDWPPDATLLAWVRSSFQPRYFARENLLVWLALWGEIAVNDKLRGVHRRLYEAYRSELAFDIAAVAARRGKQVNASALARNFIALVDGLWLEWCLDDQVMTPAEAEEASIALLESALGSLREA
ncbi:TetR family transcriptional regulator C-terminal domain-containing protein [Labrys okinawensis]|uniref:TetR family transcriptional regulator C-terminal domain-containing protein n=1 Tax=Labrys okinawensis TaxID=346911 RepID=UPI0039BD3227